MKHLRGNHIIKQGPAQQRRGNTANSGRNHVCYRGRHFDGEQTGKAHQEPNNTLSRPFVVSERSKGRPGTYGNERSPDERVQFRKLAGSKNDIG